MQILSRINILKYNQKWLKIAKSSYKLAFEKLFTKVTFKKTDNLEFLQDLNVLSPLIAYPKAKVYQFEKMQADYDLVIIGAGCVGVAAAYYALKDLKGTENQLSVALIERSDIFSSERYWSSSYSARQNRVQYNEQYLTRFVLASNKEWADLEAKFGKKDQLFLKEGSLWFGDKNVNTNEGNIKAANGVITILNSKSNEDRIQSLYMEKIMQGSPQYMNAFKPLINGQLGKNQSEWDRWSALYQPDGGSVNMQQSYQAFLTQIQHEKRGRIYNQTQIKSHQTDNNSPYRHSFRIVGKSKAQETIKAKKVFVCAGVFTPYFLKDVLKFPHLVDNNFKDGQSNLQYAIQQYVASYIHVNDGGMKIWKNMPNYYNFLEENNGRSEDSSPQYSGYGFRYHEWDTLTPQEGPDNNFIKMGTMACKGFTSEKEERDYLHNAVFKNVQPTDSRVQAAVAFANNRLNGVDPQHSQNKHFPCPIIFFNGRQTLLDYLQRNDESIVVQSGGWIGKYFPLLAKTAVQMLFQPQFIKEQRNKSNSIVGNFLNRTRFPIKPYINDFLHQNKFAYPKASQGVFKTIVVGGGCSGLYSAFRLNKQGHTGIGVFQMSERISGRLKSFSFRGTTTPFELGGMRYIAYKHILLNKVITDLGIPSIAFPMNGDPIQNYMRKAYLRNDYYQMGEWDSNQKNNTRLLTSYRMKGHIVGMTAFQIISFSLYLILTAPENFGALVESFLTKTAEDIDQEKRLSRHLGQVVRADEAYYKNWQNYITHTHDDPLNYNINLSLKQWNYLKPILVCRFPYEAQTRAVYQGQERVPINQVYPLYKFGYQNVIEAQFGHQAYQFTAEQNGYFSNTSNASYLDQVMTYLLDFGDVAYHTLAGGYDNINYGMANELVSKQSGVQTKDGGIYLGHKLVDIEKTSDNKYLLTFHFKSQLSAYHGHQMEKENFKRYLHSGVHKKKICNLKHNKIGVSVPLPDKKGYSSIQFIADRIILGMPKRSIQLLFNEIDILQQPITNYKELYQADRLKYEAIFNLAQLNAQKQLLLSGLVPPLNQKQLNKLKQLLQKQKNGPPNQGPALTEDQVVELNDLANANFLNNQVKSALEDVDFQYQRLKKPLFDDAPLLPTNLTTLADSTQAMPAMKICLNFTQNWWDPTQRMNKEYQKIYKNTNLVNSVEEMRGVSVTDLPVRQTLYFGQGPDNLLLGSYNDMITTQFWTTLHNNFHQQWQPIGAVQKKLRVGAQKKIISYPRNQDINPAKKVLVKEILKQLSLIHNIPVKEEWLKECIYQFWGNDPFGAGYHNFYSGYYIPTVMQSIRKPWLAQKIYFVGEAYSNETGWVEGAFQTAQRLLVDELKLPSLVQNYYAGY